jgi:8-oxo-dGTP pyrophosphatase MutT (NUDIX family)
VEESEDLAEAGKREIIEETGYSDIEFVKEFERSFECVSSADHKKQNRSAHIRVLHFKLNSEQIEEIEEYEKNQHEVKWVPIEKVPSEITGPESQKVFEIFKTS